MPSKRANTTPHQQHRQSAATTNDVETWRPTSGIIRPQHASRRPLSCAKRLHFGSRRPWKNNVSCSVERAGSAGLEHSSSAGTAGVPYSHRCFCIELEGYTYVECKASSCSCRPTAVSQCLLLCVWLMFSPTACLLRIIPEPSPQGLRHGCGNSNRHGTCNNDGAWWRAPSSCNSLRSSGDCTRKRWLQTRPSVPMFAHMFSRICVCTALDAVELLHHPSTSWQSPSGVCVLIVGGYAYHRVHLRQPLSHPT